jgi:hypothetical protein
MQLFVISDFFFLNIILITCIYVKIILTILQVKLISWYIDPISYLLPTKNVKWRNYFDSCLKKNRRDNLMFLLKFS